MIKKAAAMVEGGGNIGLGHIMRSLQLVETLAKRSVIVEHFLVSGDRVAVDLVEFAGYPCEFIDGMDLLSISEWFYSRNIDCLIVDQASDASVLCQMLRKQDPRLFIFALDPPIMNFRTFDLIVKLFHHGIETQIEFDASRYVEGLEYALLRSDFLQEGLRGGRRRGSVSDVLVSFGGTDPSGMTVKMLEALKLDFIDGLSFHVVIGPGCKDAPQIRRLAAILGSAVVLHENIRNMPSLMCACDIGVISSGSTLMEMCYLGIPSLAIAHNPGEARFASYFQQLGATVLLGEAKNINLQQIIDELRWLNGDITTREQMATNGMAIVDGKGAERLADLLQNRINQSYNE